MKTRGYLQWKDHKDQGHKREDCEEGRRRGC